MTKEIPMTKSENALSRLNHVGSFGLRHSLVIRHYGLVIFHFLVIRTASFVIFSAVLLAGTIPAPASGVRVRDLVMVAGARDNQLVGYGLVAGLNNEGDKDPIYTQATLANMLQRYGIKVPATTLSSKNVAVVMVTAEIPAFIKPGQRLDVQVASMGDANRCKAACCCKRRCSARTTRSMPWPKARSWSADSLLARAARAARR